MPRPSFGRSLLGRPVLRGSGWKRFAVPAGRSVGRGGGVSSAFGLDFKVAKTTFFDRAHIKKLIRRACQDENRLRKAGSWVAQAARSSMREVRKRTNYSSPGSPPHAHVGMQAGAQRKRKDGRKGTNFGLKVILFGYSAARGGTIVGPVGPRSGRGGGMTVPEVHEKGGSLTISVADKSDRRPRRARSERQARAFQEQIRKGRIQGRERQMRRILRTARYPKRAFMWPALVKTAAKLPGIWQGSLAGGGA